MLRAQMRKMYIDFPFLVRCDELLQDLRCRGIDLVDLPVSFAVYYVGEHTSPMCIMMAFADSRLGSSDGCEAAIPYRSSW